MTSIGLKELADTLNQEFQCGLEEGSGKHEERQEQSEKEMATHSSVLAWRIPGTGEPGGLLSMGSHRVGQTEVT